MDTNTLQQHQQQQQLIQQYKKTYTHTATKRILIVNYEYDVNFALKLVLEEENGFQVDFSNDPISALKNFKNGSYDLLIIGVVMPEMNGFELAKQIRKIDYKVKTCFLIAGEIPSKVRFDTSSSGQGEGYQDKFIRLPIENKDLVEQIDKIII
jgi:two-component system, OmpR family, response regulator